MMRSFGPPEFDVVLLGSREHVAPSTVPLLQERIAQCSDVGYFIRQALINKTYPLVSRALRELPEQENPFLQSACHELRKYIVQRWMPHRSRLERATNDVRKVLQEAEVPFAFIRGLPFAGRFYAHPELRVAEDMDLLVHESRREVAEQALLSLGFSYREGPEKRGARAAYMGQTEFSHADNVVSLDLNWRLTGNASIGDVCLDMDAIWSRAQEVAGQEYALSTEDLLVDSVRHSCHGHNFGTGLVKTCVDVAAVLRSTQDDIDWDYVRRQTATGEFLRGFAFFGWFYDHCYRQSDDESRLDAPTRIWPRVATTECRLFTATIYSSELRLRPVRREVLREVILENLGIVAKLWALDGPRRLSRLLKIVAWPTQTELVLLVGRNTRESIIKMRLKHWLLSLLIAPSILCGITVRLAVPVVCLFPSRQGHK